MTVDFPLPDIPVISVAPPRGSRYTSRSLVDDAAEQDAVASTRGGMRKIVRDDRVDQLADTGTVVAAHNQIGGVLHCRQRVLNRRRAAARHQEGVVVLGVAHAHDVVRREFEPRQRCGEAGRLVDASG